MKAKRNPRNAVEFALYGFMEAMSAAHRYQEVYTCHGCGDIILEPDRMVTDNNYKYHNSECVMLAEVADENE